MKNILYIFLLFCQTIWSQTAFDNGNKLYQNGNYQEAISSYEKVLKTEQHSSELYFSIVAKPKRFRNSKQSSFCSKNDY
jgi:tetratricopeptide (TPR) repeat protein